MLCAHRTCYIVQDNNLFRKHIGRAYLSSQDMSAPQQDIVRIQYNIIIYTYYKTDYIIRAPYPVALNVQLLLPENNRRSDAENL